MVLIRRQVIGAFTGVAVAAGAALTPLTAQAELLSNNSTVQNEVAVFAQAVDWSRNNRGIAISLVLGTAFIQPDEQVISGLKNYLGQYNIDCEVFIERNNNVGSAFALAFDGFLTELYPSTELQVKLDELINVLRSARDHGLTPTVPE